MFCLNIVLSLRVDVNWSFVLETAIVVRRRYFYFEKSFVSQVIILLPYNNLLEKESRKGVGVNSIIFYIRIG